MPVSHDEASISSFCMEYIFDFIVAQNKQLLKVIAEDYGLDYDELVKLIPTHKDIIKFTKG